MKKMLIFILIIYAMFIFSMSIDGQSNQRTLAVSKVIIAKIGVSNFSSTLNKNNINSNTINKSNINNGSKNSVTTNSVAIKKINFIIRKGAHFFVYFFFAVVISSAAIKFRFSFCQSAGYILFFCLLMANTDELIQNYVGGRTSLVQDCFIDFVGAIFGMVFTFSIYYIMNSFRTRKLFLRDKK
jgi:VanZ family protein